MSVVSVIQISASDIISINKPYTVSFESPTQNAYPKLTYKEEHKLTDGQLASDASYNDSAFTSLYRGNYSYIVIDLEKVYAIDKIEVRSLQNKKAGILCPREISVSLSEDGEHFGTVASLYDSESITKENTSIVTHSVSITDKYKGRYVKVMLSSDVFLYVDEIYVYGNENTQGCISAEPDIVPADKGFAKSVDGLNNICLLYTCGSYSEQVLLPYFAYLDKEKNVVDTMFDSMIFLPSGSSGFDFSQPSGWDAYIKELFGINNKTNLTALDILVKNQRENLGLPSSYKYPVFISIPYIDSGSYEFDGLLPINCDNKIEIIKNYIDIIKNDFSANFNNLELKGFYWHEEIISYSWSNYEEDLIKKFNEYVHKIGLKSLWIPYYCATGYTKATELGFDAAALQSGYAFDHSSSQTGDSLPGVLDDCAAMAHKYGLGMEFELDTGVANFYKRFYKYVTSACSSGCMEDSMMMMYQGVNYIYTCANSSKDSDLRKVYDVLYQYIHNTFTSIAPVIEEGQLIIAEVNSRVSGTIIINDPDSKKTELKNVSVSAAEGLSAIFEGSGFYLVNTANTLPGCYNVSLQVSDGYNTSNTADICVIVVDSNNPFPEKTFQNELTVYSDLSMKNEIGILSPGTVFNYYCISDDVYYVSYLNNSENVRGIVKADIFAEETNNTGWIIYLIIALVAIAVIIVVIVIIIKKNQNQKQ